MTDETATTDTQTSTSQATTDAGALFMRPTPAERRAGRFMRAPDHDAGTAEPAPAAPAADAGAPSDAGSGTPPGDAGAVAEPAADATLLGAATTEAGTGDDKGDSGEKPEPAAATDPAGAPEAYELKLTTAAEDGTETVVDLDPVLVEAATPLLKDAGLNNEQANKLLPLVPQVQAQLLKQQSDQFAQVKSDWDKQTREDPELGGKNLTETLRLAAKGLDHFTGPNDDKNEFRKLLNETGLGNHPVMVKWARDVGASLSEDNSFVRNTTDPKVQKSREEVNYPNDVPKTS